MAKPVKQNNRDIFANSSSVKELIRHFNKIKYGINATDSKEFLRHIERVKERELSERQASVEKSKAKKKTEPKPKPKPKPKAKPSTTPRGGGAGGVHSLLPSGMMRRGSKIGKDIM
tara:strand:- start:165 stop:512 length:348 start_codon:yes stop_codon:yes gene_type:complete